MVRQAPDGPRQVTARSIEDRLTRIEAIEAIRTLVARYAIGADRQNDPDLMGELFAEDATWQAKGFGLYEGRTHILAALAEIGRTQMVWTTHYNVAPFIELDADLAGARCRWYLWELASMAEHGVHTYRWVAGTYDARLARIGDEWRFTNVVLDLRLMADASAPGFSQRITP